MLENIDHVNSRLWSDTDWYTDSWPTTAALCTVARRPPQMLAIRLIAVMGRYIDDRYIVSISIYLYRIASLVSISKTSIYSTKVHTEINFHRERKSESKFVAYGSSYRKPYESHGFCILKRLLDWQLNVDRRQHSYKLGQLQAQKFVPTKH